MNLYQSVFKIFSTTLIIASLTAAITQAQTNIQQPRNVEQQLVKLNVIVTDASNRPVNDVRQGEFRVFENGSPQTISFFSNEEMPLLYGIVIDNSGSFKSVLKPVVNAAKTTITQNKPGDETFLVRFTKSEIIETVKDFTSDKRELFRSLDSLYIEGGESAVIDAVYLSVQRVAQYKKAESDKYRRAIILMTDGEDRASYYKKDQLIKLLQKENVQVFVIGIVNILDDWGSLQVRSPRERAVNLINSFTEETGGLAFFPKSPKELQNTANEFMLYLQTQYVVGYIPTGQERENPYHKVSVKLLDSPERKKHVVTTRTGYITLSSAK
jgi:Ca-activated chloride channel homolog